MWIAIVVLGGAVIALGIVIWVMIGWYKDAAVKLDTIVVANYDRDKLHRVRHEEVTKRIEKLEKQADNQSTHTLSSR